MTEVEWLACEDPTAMVQTLGRQLRVKKRRLVAKALRDRLSDRKLRLFACACCRRVWHLLSTGADRQAVEVAERHADRVARLERLTDRLDERDRAVLADAQEVLSRLVAIAHEAPTEPPGGSRARPEARRTT